MTDENTRYKQGWDCAFRDPHNHRTVWHGHLSFDDQNGATGTLHSVEDDTNQFDDRNDDYHHVRMIHCSLNGKTPATLIFPSLKVSLNFSALFSRAAQFQAPYVIIGSHRSEPDERWVKRARVSGGSLLYWLDSKSIRSKHLSRRSPYRMHASKPITFRGRLEDGVEVELSSFADISERGSYDRRYEAIDNARFEIIYRNPVHIREVAPQSWKIEAFFAILTGHFKAPSATSLSDGKHRTEGGKRYSPRFQTALIQRARGSQYREPAIYEIISTSSTCPVDVFSALISFLRVWPKLKQAVHLFRRASTTDMPLEDRFFSLVRAVEIGCSELLPSRDDDSTNSNLATLETLVARSGNDELKSFFKARIKNAIRPQPSLARLLRMLFDHYDFLRPFLPCSVDEIAKARGNEAHGRGNTDIYHLNTMASTIPILHTVFNFMILEIVGFPNDYLQATFETVELHFYQTRNPPSVHNC